MTTLRYGVALGVAGLALASGVAAAKAPAPWTNCTTLNKRYPHGVGKAKAHDKTKSGDPVTTFKRSTALYLKAMKANSRLDRDKDGIACEK